MDTQHIHDITERVLAGGEITSREALALDCMTPEESLALRESAARVTSHFSSRVFDSCSIINARSGRCPEDCKWCAQSAHYGTTIHTYPLVDRDTCMETAAHNRNAGIRRFSLVTSGRTIKGNALDTVCSYYSRLRIEEPGMCLCASMGLLDDDAMAKLHKAGVQRYHCNMESSRSYFPTLCTTHTQDDKLTTIERARRAGFEICSGGIIGMGETMRQRIELALELREFSPVSIPINVLHPIPGTPLENSKPVTDDEYLDTIAIFRMIHPRAVLRFAGGRACISPQAQREALRIAINGAIMGDMLTTVGSQIESDKKMVKEAGYEW